MSRLNITQPHKENLFCRHAIQKDLENNHDRVRAIMHTMETVEKEWEQRAVDQEQLAGQLAAARADQEQLAGQLAASRAEEEQLRQQLAAAMQAIQSQKIQLEK